MNRLFYSVAGDGCVFRRAGIMGRGMRFGVFHRMTGERLTPVIMCGGAGTRLWPVSRESMPKQFVPLIGDRSTFQQTLARVSDPDLFERPIVITNSDFRFIVAEQLREIGIEADIVLEPMRRDSGPAVAVAAALAARRDPDATVLVLAADHVVHKTPEFHAACRSAAAAAAMGLIATFGIRPTAPATNYGYIRPGAKLNGAATLAVEAFVEKPDAATATRYVAENYLWNSGNFMFRADVMLDEIARFEPEMAEAARAAVAEMTQGSRFPAACRRAVRARAEEIDRLCGDGAHQARRRRAGRHGLVGHRKLGRGLGGARSRRGRQRDVRADRDARQPQQPGARRGQCTHRRGRSRQCGGDRDRRCRAGRGARQGRERQGAGRAAQGAEPPRGGGASPHLPAVGLLPGRRQRRALSGQAHRGEAGRAAFAAEALPPRRALGRGARAPPRSRSATTFAPCTKTNPSTSRSAACIASPIRARSRWS